MAMHARAVVRAILLGLLSWLIPFVTGFVLFSVKKTNAALFTSLMDLVVLATAGSLMTWYFRKRPFSAREAVGVGALWFAINLVCDYPMFAYGPMKMTPLTYYSEIGLVYLTFPVFALMAARLGDNQPDETPHRSA